MRNIRTIYIYTYIYIYNINDNIIYIYIQNAAPLVVMYSVKDRYFVLRGRLSNMVSVVQGDRLIRAHILNLPLLLLATYQAD